MIRIIGTCVALAIVSFGGVSFAQELDYRPANTIPTIIALADAQREGLGADTLNNLLGSPRTGNEFEARKSLKAAQDLINENAQQNPPIGVAASFWNADGISAFDFDRNVFYVCFPETYISARMDEWKRFKGSSIITWDMAGVRELLPKGKLSKFGCVNTSDQASPFNSPIGDSSIVSVAIPVRFNDLEAAEILSNWREIGGFEAITFCDPDWLSKENDYHYFRIKCDVTKLELKYWSNDGPVVVFSASKKDGEWIAFTNEELVKPFN